MVGFEKSRPGVLRFISERAVQECGRARSMNASDGFLLKRRDAFEAIFFEVVELQLAFVFWGSHLCSWSDGLVRSMEVRELVRCLVQT